MNINTDKAMSLQPSTGGVKRPKTTSDSTPPEIKMAEMLYGNHSIIPDFENLAVDNDLIDVDIDIDADQPSSGSTTRPK